MDHQPSTNNTGLKQPDKTIVLPLLALLFDLMPVLIIYIGSMGLALRAFIILPVLLFPVAGLITGIVSLCRKERLSTAAKIIAFIAVALPLSLVAFVVIFFVGAVTGLISFM